MVQYSPQDGPAVIRGSYLSGTAAACGTTSTAITAPTGASLALIHAEGAAVYWSVNASSVVGSTAPGYVAQDQVGFIPEIDNLTKVAVIGGASGAIAHVEFYQF